MKIDILDIFDDVIRNSEFLKNIMQSDFHFLMESFK